jgi:hypothetical protein
MFKSTFIRSLLIATLLTITIGSSYADKRSYVWTYEYLTVDPGKWEVEYYNTSTTPEAGTFAGKTSTVHQLELEVGMGEGFDFAVYQIFKQSPGAGLFYDGMKFRTRYKIGKKGDFFVDPLIYLEYQTSNDFQKNAIEAKFILAKDFGKFNISLNPIVEFEKYGHEEWEFIPGYAFGINYALGHSINLGIESKGDKDAIYVGPTITHGIHNLWAGISPLFAINEVEPGKPEFQLRLILAFGN